MGLAVAETVVVFVFLRVLSDPNAEIYQRSCFESWLFCECREAQLSEPDRMPKAILVDLKLYII